MSIIEKQTELSKSLYQINASTLRETFSLQKENIEKYIETNRAFGSKISDIKDISGFISLQKEYGETLWTNAVESYKAQSCIVRGAFKDTGAAVKTAFGETATTEEDEIKQEAKAPVAPKTSEATASEATASEAAASETVVKEKPKAVAKKSTKKTAKKDA